MKRMLALALPLLALAGCEIHPVDAYCHYDDHGDYHCHDSHSYDSHVHSKPATAVVYAAPAKNGGGSNNNIIVIEEEPTCDIWHESPFYESPDWCDEWGECEWYIGYGCYEVWAWSEWDCHWYYQYDYCIY